ncbi:MAG: protein TolQ [Rhodospirillaceae bacterium]|jgi:biopolymer transport protein TolQ|nr:protein TolQ [Alphaproteobacteria bacterium]MBL13046.1 protein TolQ [Rhodospirillaceae bacterium]MBR85636.1 protein TolQ [Rhodospirillaceae bacterium]PPR66020.1 MAG: Biopolymer transport protein ExbB [Alphaproteobacteria bacterium MarineAlpha3_Bin7]|tara:strand:- start:331 stop:1053 length:723 start_codon:yes stop_codon:yes gene_type:complete
METEAINTVGLAAASGDLDFSVWTLFLRADLIVKLVMLLLLSASVWCWAIIIEKSVRLRRLNRDATEFEDSFWSGGSLDALYDRIGAQPLDPMGAVFSSAMKEWRRSAETGNLTVDRGSSLTERIERVMDVTLSRELEHVERQMIILASTGSTAPFIGLFGTVWGIMNSFQSIAMSKNTSLAVVAPGIAEALFATALGLLAAIPAVIAYNKISKDLDRYAARLEDFSSEFSAIISRQLDS